MGAYEQGVHKSKYWEDTFEDSMDLVAKLPVVAATIYNNLFREGAVPCPPDPAKDWSANFCEMIGYKDPQFTELMRLPHNPQRPRGRQRVSPCHPSGGLCPRRPLPLLHRWHVRSCRSPPRPC